MPTLDDNIPATCRRLQALAERDPQRAVPLTRRALAACPPDASRRWGWASYTLGWALLCWERFDQCRPHLQAAQAVFQAHTALLEELRCRYALLLADINQSAPPELEGLFVELAEQFERASAPIEAAHTRLQHAAFLNAMERTRDAEAVLGTYEAAAAVGDVLYHARWLRVKAVTANMRGDYTSGEALLNQVEPHFAQFHYHVDLAKCRFERGRVLVQQEQLKEALSVHTSVEQDFRKLDLPLRIAFSIKAISFILSRQGVYDEALQLALAALHHFETFNRAVDIGGCHLNLGNIYLYTGRWEAALAHYVQADALFVATNSTELHFLVQRNQATVYRAQGRYTEALRLLAVVEQQAQQAGNQVELAEIRSLQADLLVDQGYYEEALEYYQQAHDLCIAIKNLTAAAYCDLARGWLALQHDAVARARMLFEGALPALLQHPHHRWRVDYGLACCAEIQGDSATALDNYVTACTTVAALRRQLVSEEVSSHLYTQAARLHADALRLAARQGAIEVLLKVAEGQRALVLQRTLATRLPTLPEMYQEQHEILRRHIGRLLDGGQLLDERRSVALDVALQAYGELLLQARHSPSTVTEETVPPPDRAFDLAGLRAELAASYGDDWTALVYVVNGDTMLIVAVTPTGLDLAQTAYDGRLQRLFKRASERSYRIYTYRNLEYLHGQTSRPWATLQELADQLLPPMVRTRLHPRHRLLVVPSGPLHGLPWAALRLHESWLAERAVVQVLPALTAWGLLASRVPAGDTALLLGCSDFGERATPLPGVVAELEVVARHWPSASVRELEATRASLLDRSVSGELARYALLHIASHARLLPARGLAAHLRLHDSDLLLPEVAALHLAGALVTLSTCDGAAPDTLPGEEVLSLSWALLAAGAGAVLASLWPVLDDAVALLLEHFYDALWQHGDAPLALALAQRALIATYIETADLRAEPLCWCSFLLTGGGLGYATREALKH